MKRMEDKLSKKKNNEEMIEKSQIPLTNKGYEAVKFERRNEKGSHLPKTLTHLTLTNKNAQEEMFGFILIVVLLVVIGLILLFFTRPQAAEPERSAVVSNLLYTMLSYSSDGTPVREIIEECYAGREFMGEDACSYLEGLFGKMLDVSLRKGALVVGNQLNGYSFMLEGKINITQGTQEGNRIGSLIPIKVDSESKDAILSFYY